ncbi:TIGR03915 family putative DNA repair protein [Changchengzhania lutea]|uniref:TIGR03915 family putative DNA repair protein n=1 Tax=Changchengzhania lutea TaxID=2049305 RepID=UPI00115E5F3F|nr:TIGR03915 family putative DNA repair protein [Changchengzhania lutea]
MEVSLIYDGTFDGFLSAVFEAFELKASKVNIQKQSQVQNTIFSESVEVTTDHKKSDRVWNGLKKKLSAYGRNQLYYAFLSEIVHVENVLYDYIQQTFSSSKSIEKDFSNATVLKISKLAKSVGREKHRMEAFVRFKLTKDDIYFANIEPDFNVLPLISKHFERRYADQKWIIYDIKRKFGIYYNLKDVEVIEINFSPDFNFTKTDGEYFKDEELDFQQLWQDYFKSTNIESRINMALHIRHVPKRYWKYLSEKQV